MDIYNDKNVYMDKYSDKRNFDSISLPLSKNNLSTRLNSMVRSMKLFFASFNLKSSISSSGSSTTSSGYGSLDSSCELDESYIKVSRFSEDEHDGEYGFFGTYKEYKEMVLLQKIASDIKTVVEKSTDRRIQISDYLTLRTANDVIDLSKCEPYGLKGCKLILMIQDRNEVIVRRSIYPDQGLMSTFEITLVLHLKKNMSSYFRLFDSNRFSILEQYELRKEKLYTSKHRHPYFQNQRKSV